VSLYNQSKSGGAIAPSPIVACVGGIADISKTATSAFKRAGSTLRYLGVPQAALGGSVFADVMGVATNALPVPAYATIRAALGLLAAAYARDLVCAAHDVSDGGLLACVAEMAFPTLAGSPLGARLYAPGWAGDVLAHEVWFAEYGGFVVEVGDDAEFARLAADFEVPAPAIGETIADPAIVLSEPRESIVLHALCERWSAPLRDFYGSAA
jgi:phosphoribosylformylglycinamidine synthase